MSYGNRDKDQALVEKLYKLVWEAEAKLSEVTAFATQHGLSFRWEGPSYGMGGYFDAEDTKDEYGDETGGWQASSMSC